MARQQQQGHWLDKYANNHAAWKVSIAPDGNQAFQRPLGLVETSFDADGTYYGGRADMTSFFTLAIQHKLSKDELRHRIALAWTSLRLQHPLLLARVHDDPDTGIRGFAVDIPSTQNAAIQAVKDNVVWIEDSYDEVNDEEIYRHAFNVTRIIEPKKCLSKIHVLPITRLPDGTFSLSLLIVIAHQISDGLSAYNWFSHFNRIMNQPIHEILADIEAFRRADKIKAILPAAQEDLYPPIVGNRARQRWFWALIRVLRHVHKGLPPTFTNPLRREQRLEVPVPLEPKFDKIFNYSASSRPPMSCGHITAALSASASSRLISLCRSAQVSIGAGCFALAGLAMMSIHEALNPSSQHPPFTASFPLNPRAWFVNPPPPESCMLAFSEGIVMPFLSSELPIEGRFKLVAKHANRELKGYQKRLKGKGTAGTAGILDKHSPARLLATGYVAQIEIIQGKLPPERRSSSYSSPQGSLPPSTAGFRATCGVSSVGSLATFFKRGTYDLQDLGDRDFAADFRDVNIGVRARENEFLVGSLTNAEGIVNFGVSYDLNAISEERAELWKTTIENLLEVGAQARL
ncbi:hypothetical protein GGP41_005081 [Bipolaris sorokiniana]|uniref:Uncharacterized protein n=2 Tax=Cochliobolus sativus TaxID=45130 RepID=A0A8H6DX26_COCSA|nr:uncharacterized protein COCSADRAFT_200677 [Bipolaris sorokiniana ND90Pr]EMD63056.1 hypothetical protein COCSADRAFT_200677 [Bipolaris sorokiniana ND90Pr]KAF5849690.1 hypothetical protein GGP41_005081 [Bipolaris sorokiniana]